MTYWIREFLNSETLQRFRVYSETQHLPALREEIAKMQKDPQWMIDTIYKHVAELDTEYDRNCPLTIALIVDPDGRALT